MYRESVRLWFGNREVYRCNLSGLLKKLCKWNSDLRLPSTVAVAVHNIIVIKYYSTWKQFNDFRSETIPIRKRGYGLAGIAAKIYNIVYRVHTSKGTSH